MIENESLWFHVGSKVARCYEVTTKISHNGAKVIEMWKIKIVTKYF